MSEEKLIRVMEFSGKKSDWEGWSEKFLAKMDKRNSIRKFYYCKELWYFKKLNN